MRHSYHAALLLLALLLGGVSWTASSQEALRVQVDGAVGSLGLDDQVAGDQVGYQELDYSEAPSFQVGVELDAVLANLKVDVHLFYEDEATPSYTFHSEASLVQGFSTHIIHGQALEWSGLYRAQMEWRVEELGIVVAQGTDPLGSVLQRVHIRAFDLVETSTTRTYAGGTYDSDANTYTYRGGEYDLLHHEYRTASSTINLGSYNESRNDYTLQNGVFDDSSQAYMVTVSPDDDGVIQQGQRIQVLIDLYNPPKYPRPFMLEIKDWDEDATVQAIEFNTSQEITLIPIDSAGMRNGLYNVEIEPLDWTSWNPDTPSTPLAVGVEAARAKVAVTTASGVEATLEVWTGTSSASSNPITTLDRRSDTTIFYMWASWSEAGILDPDHAEITYKWYNDNKFNEFYSGSATLAAKDTNYYLGFHSTSSRSYMPGSWMLWVSVDFQNSLDVSLATGDSDGAGDTDVANSHVGVVRIAPRVTAAQFFKNDYTTEDAGFMVGEPTYLDIDLSQGMTSTMYLINDGTSSTGKLQEYTAEVRIGSTVHFAMDFVPYSGSSWHTARVESGAGFVSHSVVTGYKYRLQIDPNITTYNGGEFSLSITTKQYSYFSGMKWAGILTIGSTEVSGQSFDTIAFSDQFILTGAASKPYLNRGQTTTITGQIDDAWGEAFGDKELNIDITHAQGEYDVATLVTQEDGTFATTWTAPTTAPDTYVAATPGTNEPTDYALEVHYPSSTIEASFGSHAGTPPNAGNFVLSDNFNDGTIDTEKWTTVGAVENNDCGANSGPYALKFDGATRSATTTALDVGGGGMVEFYLLISAVSTQCERADAGEDVELQFSTNGGTSWTIIAIYDTTDYPSFTKVIQPIPPTAQTSSTMFRWIQPQFSGSCCDNWAIDDVNIEGTPALPSGLLDVDANYYVASSNVVDATVNRGDTTRAVVALVDASNTPIPQGHRAILYLACQAEQDGSASADQVGQVTATFTIPIDAVEETCSIDAEVQADTVLTDGNSMLRGATGSTAAIKTGITIQSLTLAPPGEPATGFYNRGEAIRVSGVLLDGWGESPYRIVHPNGDSEREIRVHLYLDMVQGAGSVTSGTTTVDLATGAFTIDLFLPTDAPDTYASLQAGQLEGMEWDVEILDAVATPGGPTHNHGAAWDLFDVDANYYTNIIGSVETTILARGDTHRSQVEIRTVRDEPAPDGVVVEFTWRDAAEQVQYMESVQAFPGLSIQDQFFDNNDETGTWSMEVEIQGAKSENNGNSASPILLSGVVDLHSDIGIGSIDVNVAGQSTTNYFQRGETVRVTGSLLHPDGGAYRILSSWAPAPRDIQVHLHKDTPGQSGSITSSPVVVDPNTGAFSADLILPPDAPDTYTSLEPGALEAVEWDILILDGATALDDQGNRGTHLDEFDVDAGVYVGQWFEGDADADVHDLDFNSGAGRNRGPDTDYARLYVDNVRGEVTTQFTDLQVQRQLLDPYTGILEATTVVPVTANPLGFYKGNFGAFPAWTTNSIQYELLSQDAAGNHDMHGQSQQTGGRVHYIMARSAVSDRHVLRSQATSITLDFMDSYEDKLDNGVIDFSASPMQGNVNLEFRVYRDNDNTYNHQIFSSASSGSTFTHVIAANDVVDWRDLNIDVQQGELVGHEWHDDDGEFDQHTRLGLGDDDGAFLVDDLTPTQVLLDGESYLPGDTVQVTTTYAYAHGSITSTPANEAYPHLLTWFLRPDGAPLDVPLFGDANEVPHAATDAQGQTTAAITLSSDAQAWADYEVRSRTLSATGGATYDVAVQYGTPSWFAHPGSDPTNTYAATSLHNRGEEVSLHVPVLNNVLGFTPTASLVHDDDAGEILDAAGSWRANTDTAVYEWTWKPVDAASATGTPHAVLATLTLGGATSQITSPPALLHDALVADVHLQRSDALVRDGIHDEAEDTEFFIALDVVNLWFHAQNIRGEDWNGIPLHAEIAPLGSTNTKATYDEATLLDAWTPRLEYAPVPPTGLYEVTLTSPATGNTVPTVQELEILSPNTDEYILDPQGWNHYVEPGRDLDIDVRVLRWDRDTRAMQEYVPDEPPLLRLEYSDGDGSWTSITEASMTHVAGTTYRYTWSVPTGAAWLEREISASFGASFHGAWKWSPTQIAVIQKGGADPVHVVASPVIANPGEEVRLAIHESYLDATARLGNAAGTTVLVLDPAGSTASTGNPLEIGYGAYRYSYTLPDTALTGPWEVIVHTTDSITGATNAASTTFWVEADGDAALQDQLAALEARLAQDVQGLLANHAATQGAVADVDADLAQAVAALLVEHDVTQAQLSDLDADVAVALVQLLAKHDVTQAALTDLEGDVASSLAQLLLEHDLAQAALADLDADVASSLSQLLIQHTLSQGALADLDADLVQGVASLLVKHNITLAQLADLDADVASVLLQLLSKHDLSLAAIQNLDADVAASVAALLVEHDLSQAALVDLDADVASSLSQLLIQHTLSQGALADLDAEVVQGVASLLVEHDVTQGQLADLDADVASVLLQLLSKHDLSLAAIQNLDADVAAGLAALLVEHDLSQAALVDLDADVAAALSDLLFQHATTQQQIGDLHTFLQAWRLDVDASLTAFEANMSLNFQSSWNRLDANQAETRQAHDALLAEIRAFWNQHELTTSTNHAALIQSLLDHDAAVQDRVDQLLATVGGEHASTRQQVEAFHADYTQRQDAWLLEFAAYRAQHDADHAEIVTLLHAIDAKLLQQYAALLDFETSTNQALTQQQADLRAFWTDMNATLDAAEMDRATKLQDVLSALTGHTTSLQGFLTNHHDAVTAQLVSAQAFNEAAFTDHELALQSALSTTLGALQGNFTLLSTLVDQGDAETQAQLQAFWLENSQTWASWQSNHESLRQQDATSLTALIQGEHDQTRQRTAQLSEDYFNKYGLLVSDFGGYVVGGLGEEILTNREAITQGKEAGFLNLFWSSLAANIMQFVFYGVMATILLLFVSNQRARKAIKMFAPLSRVIEIRERRRRKRQQRRLHDILHRAPRDQGRARSVESTRRVPD